VTVHTRPFLRYILSWSALLSGPAPTRPNTAIWFPASSTARSRSIPSEMARAWPPAAFFLVATSLGIGLGLNPPLSAISGFVN
jgi:hypothetical protein